ncbi:hypothetical protein C8J56DRAFT_903241 [Mycena floridula]|nr:hypothetical protein C8J56DRAFT_903241 [Mycena floridula]
MYRNMIVLSLREFSKFCRRKVAITVLPYWDRDMPKTKGRDKARNLGIFALKKVRKRAAELSDSGSTDSLPETKRRCIAFDSENDFQDDPSQADPLDTASIITISTQLSEISVDVDAVPAPKTNSDVLSWISACNAKIASMGKMITAELKLRKRSFIRTKIGTTSARTDRYHRQREQEAKERETEENTRKKLKDTKISTWFAPKKAEQTGAGMISEPICVGLESDDEDEDELIQAISFSAAPTSFQVTMETVIDEDELLTKEKFVMSPEALAEEGLDEPWDPSVECGPRSESASSSLHPELRTDQQPPPIHLKFQFTTADETFQPNLSESTFPEDPSFPDPVSPVPCSVSVDQAIENLEGLLNPKRNTGRGHKIPNLPHTLHVRLEMMRYHSAN